MLEELKIEIQTQNNRGTADPIFIVVEDKKIYGIAKDYQDGEERKDPDSINFETDLCEDCRNKLEETGELPNDCSTGSYDCDDSFLGYKVEEDVPNLRAAFFFTAKACDEHIEANRHHYNETAKSYAISAYHNQQLKSVIRMLCGGIV